MVRRMSEEDSHHSITRPSSSPASTTQELLSDLERTLEEYVQNYMQTFLVPILEETEESSSNSALLSSNTGDQTTTALIRVRSSSSSSLSCESEDDEKAEEEELLFIRRPIPFRSSRWVEAASRVLIPHHSSWNIPLLSLNDEESTMNWNFSTAQTLSLQNIGEERYRFDETIRPDALLTLCHGVDHDCQICLEPLIFLQQVYDLKCKHWFHKECLEKTVQFQNLACPICRSTLPIRRVIGQEDDECHKSGVVFDELR